MEKLHASKAFLKIAGGRMHTLHPIPLDPPLAIQKPSKESGIFQSLGIANFVLFTKRQSQKVHGTMAVQSSVTKC